jgi:thiazole tautomerase (transcriptional regulator TenI)
MVPRSRRDRGRLAGKLTASSPPPLESPAKRRLPFVHAVSNSAAVARRDFLVRAARVMHALGPRGAMHLRSSRASGRQFHDLASELVSVQSETGCWLIVNDRVDIAAAVGAWGIQLASHSLRVPEARAVAPIIPVGISVHTLEEATEAEKAGASWCVAGTVFETPSHAGREGAKIPFIEEIANAVSIPIIAIGGIRPEHVPLLKDAGAYGVATIRGVDWERGMLRQHEGKSEEKTGSGAAASAATGEPITRYISAYDWDSDSEREHHPHRKRRASGYSAE